MRTTVRLDDHLLAEAKKLAADQGRTLSDILESALQEVLARRKPQGKRAPLRLPVFKGKGLLPGVDLDDTSSLLELMDRGHGPA